LVMVVCACKAMGTSAISKSRLSTSVSQHASDWGVRLTGSAGGFFHGGVKGVGAKGSCSRGFGLCGFVFHSKSSVMLVSIHTLVSKW
jgi:hypothetical protein